MISQHIVEEVLQEAKRKDATAADLILIENELVTAQVRLRETETLRSAKEVRLGLRLFFGKRSATSSTSDLSRESLAQLVEDTTVLAKATAHDECSGLPAAEECAKSLPDLHLYDPDGEALTVSVPIDRARAGHRADRAAARHGGRASHARAGAPARDGRRPRDRRQSRS